MQWLETLNEAQHQAATAGQGPVLIVAGPGTGKTKTLTSRVAYLLASGAVQPAELLALTFTKKAAEEMRHRAGLLMPAAADATISTFHGLCFELLGDTGLQFVDDARRISIIKSLQKPAGLKQFSARELGLYISRSKNMAGEDPGIRQLAAAYDAELANLRMMDFDDLLLKARDLLRHDEAVRTAAQNRYKHILVDEFQDTNLLQYELLALLRGHDNLFVIGDPNQSIYGFRGASGSIFDRFRQDFPAHNAVTLTANYRSVPQVVQLANEVFPRGSTLRAQGGRLGRVRAVQVLNEYSEAAWVCGAISAEIGGGTMLDAVSDDMREQHRTLRDFAVLYRNRSAAAAVQKAIAESGLPYQIVGEGSPYEQPNVQALIAVMRAMGEGVNLALEGFNSSEMKAIRDLVGDAGPTAPAKLADRLAQILGFAESPGVRQFINVLVRFDTVPEAVAYCERISETGFYDPAADCVTLLTIHASKGLEFPYVFLVGAEEGILPHGQADADEERRLFYVAVTRAQEMLDITYANNRGGKPATVSRFVTELRPSVLPRVTDPKMDADRQRAKKRALKRSQQSLF